MQTYKNPAISSTSANTLGMSGHIKFPIHKERLPYLDQKKVVYRMTTEPCICKDMAIIEVEPSMENIINLTDACVRFGLDKGREPYINFYSSTSKKAI